MTLPPKLKMIGEEVLVYSVALGVIGFESRGVDVHKELHDLASAKLWWFVPATLVSFLIWFLGENLLFARLFTHFHKATGYVEMLPGTAAAYFLQVVNVLIADGALMVFLHQRKRVPWVASGFTMAYFGFIDGIVFAFAITAAGVLVPSSPVQHYVPYSTAALVFFLVVAAWWRWRKPYYSFEKWLYERPSLVAFRKATAEIYGELLLIRFLILAPQGALLWICFASFHVHIPLLQVFAETPVLLAAGGSPITPAGLGPLQAVAVHAFSNYSTEAQVMVASLAFSVLHLVYRLPLGLGSASIFVRSVLRSGGNPEEEEPRQERNAPAREAQGR